MNVKESEVGLDISTSYKNPFGKTFVYGHTRVYPSSPKKLSRDGAWSVPGCEKRRPIMVHNRKWTLSSRGGTVHRHTLLFLLYFRKRQYPAAHPPGMSMYPRWKGSSVWPIAKQTRSTPE